MARRSQAFLAAAALAAALSLTGCGIPDFVIGLCDSALMPTMAQSAIDGLNKVQNQCRMTFKANSQINMCISNGAKLLNDAKTDTMPEFVTQCSEYVIATVCVEGSKCDGKPDKITPQEAQPAVQDYVNTNAGSLTVRMAALLDENIRKVVTEHYDEKYRNRAVPAVAQQQCGDQIQLKIGSINPPILNAPTQRIFEVCSRRFNDRFARKTCQDRGMTKIHEQLRVQTRRFRMQCAKGALMAACPKGSPCAIETWQADVSKLSQDVVTFLWNNYPGWLNTVKAQIMQTANSNNYYRLNDDFEMPAWKGSGLLTLISIGAVVGGVGLVVAGVRFTRKRSTRDLEATQAETHLYTSEGVELMSADYIEA